MISFQAARFVDDPLEHALHELRIDGPRCLFSEPSQHLAFTLRIVDREPGTALDLSDLLHELGALPEQAKDLGIDAVDAFAELREVGGRGHVRAEPSKTATFRRVPFTPRAPRVRTHPLRQGQIL
jgi:hypothetical protein